jgi:hypothetical protein
MPRLTRVVLVAGLLCWVVQALARWSLAVPLGHDEARYALDARDLLIGATPRFFYSAPGMTLVALPGLLAGGSEQALRVVPILLGFGFLLAAWNLARTVAGPHTAAWAVAALASSRHLSTNSSELLSDLPSGACLLLAITVLVIELSRPDGIRWRIVVAAPLCAAAFYVRFGSAAAIAVIAGAFALVGHRAMRRRPWPVVCMVGLFAVLLVPHAIRSLQVTGTITGILEMSATIPGEASGPWAYLRDPFGMYGGLVAPLMLLGLIGFRRDRIALGLVLAATGHIALLSMTTQAQPRFVYVATVLLVILGCDALVAAVRARPRITRIAAAAAIVALCVPWLGLRRGLVRYREVRVEGNARTFVAADIIRADLDPAQPCEVVAGGDRTRLEWYSRCAAVIDPRRDDAQLYEVRDGTSMALPDGATRIAYIPAFIDVIRRRR